MARDYASVGNKLGPKLAKIVSQTVIHTRRAMMPLEHHMRVKATQDIIDRMGHEVADHYGPLLDQILAKDNGHLDPTVRQFLEDARSGDHQLKAIGGLLMGSTQGAIGTLLSNQLAPLVYKIVSENPNLDIDPANAASATARGIVGYDNSAGAAADQGYDVGVFDTMMKLAQTPPGVTAIQELVNRGQLTEAQAAKWLKFNGLPDELQRAILSLRNTELSPADLALAVLRGEKTKQEGYDLAARVGTSNSQFDTLLANTGEPPGLMQLLEAYRRHFIDKVTLRKGILQSRVRDEWIPTLEQLRYVPMTVSDAVNAVVQNHLAASEAVKIADQNGLEPGAIDTLFKTAGEPLSRTEMSQLFNRGEATEAEFKQALRESRVKDKYIDQAFRLHVRLLEPRMLSSAVEYGAITREHAIQLALEYGFSKPDAETLVNEGTQRKLFSYRNQVSGAIERLYEENALSHEEATSQLHDLGHNHEETSLILKVAEYRRVARAKGAVLTAIRAKYLEHHITRNQASGYMDKAQVPPGQRDFLLELWDIERSAYVRTLTEAQTVKAVSKQLISPAEGLARLVRMGYTELDAGLLLAGA